MRRHLLAMGMAALAAVAGPARAGQFSSLYVFGDSYSDAGNLYALSGGTVPASPPYAGRFSNGPVAVEYLASSLGLPFTYSLNPLRGTRGLDYAFGGAETGTAPLVGPFSLGLLGQVNQFKADVLSHAVSFNSSALFLLEGGGNDLFNNIATTPAPTIIANAANNIATEAATLYALGARQIGIATVFHLGLTPAGAASGAAATLNLLSDALNAAYATAIATLSATYLGADFFLLNTGADVNGLIANAGALGFTDSTTPCLVGGVACANPNQHVFWDDKHPTTAFHALLGAELAAQLVPEPGSMALLGAGLALLAWRRGRPQGA